MIRTATKDDLPLIVDLAAEFLSYSPHAWMEIDREAFAEAAGRLIDGAGIIFLSDDGFIGGVLTACYFNPATTLASELFWFARKEGPELLAAFEAWARESGASAITTSGLADGHERAIRRVFARNGYVASEIAFTKRIT